MRSGYNNLSITAYSEGGTTPLTDASGALLKAENVMLATGYPGGLYMDASFYVSRDVVQGWIMQQARRVVVLNGLETVYEGYLADLETQVDESAQGVRVNLVGAWSDIMMTQTIRKPWADDRVNEDVWVWQETAGDIHEEIEIQRTGGNILMYPAVAAFSTGEYSAVRYTAPIGETVKRLYYKYDFAENTGTWEMSVYRSTDGTTFTQMGTAETYTTGTTTVITATASGTIDVTLATPSRYIDLRYYARGSNNPVRTDHDHAEWQDIQVYTETGSINQREITIDATSYLSDYLNSTTAHIGTPGSALSLVPFVVDRYDTWADVLTDAAQRGDGSLNAWAVQLIASDNAPTPDGKPVLKTEQIPSLTDGGYDYIVRLDDPNLVAPYRVAEDRAAIRNYIIVGYSDELGFDQWITPDVDANLKDTSSIAAYGERHEALWLGNSTTAIATAAGRKYLALYKDPQYRVTGPVIVQGYIVDQYGARIPASHVTAGKRLRIANYLEPQNLGATLGLTVLITQTRYDDSREICQMYCGKLDTLIIPQVTFAPQRMARPADSGGGGGERDRLNWKRRWGLPKELWEESKKWTWKQKQDWIAQARARKRRRG